MRCMLAARHLGSPLGCAEIGASLFADGGLRFDPADPNRSTVTSSYPLASGSMSLRMASFGRLQAFWRSKRTSANGSETPVIRNMEIPPASKQQPGLSARYWQCRRLYLSGNGQLPNSTLQSILFDHHVIAHMEMAAQEGVACEAIVLPSNQQIT